MGHKPPVTPEKALAYAVAEAQRRWGPHGTAWHPRYAVAGDANRCCVGVTEGQHVYYKIVYGIGRDFAEAFADAEKRGHDRSA